MSTIPGYPAPVLPLSGAELVPAWQNGGTVAIPISAMSGGGFSPEGGGVGTTVDARCGLLLPFVAPNGILAAWLDPDTFRPWYGNGGDIVGRIIAVEAWLNSLSLQLVDGGRSGLSIAVKAPSGILLLSADKDTGIISLNGVPVATTLIALQAQINALVGGVASFPDFPTNDIAAWGDSLTAVGSSGNWPATLASNLGINVYNGGIFGQGTAQIAARQGGTPARVTLTGNQIPTGSGAIVVTAIARSPLSASSSIIGTIGGVAGTLALDGSGNTTFTPAAAVSAVVAIPAGTMFVPADAISTRNHIQLIGTGRNSFSGAGAQPMSSGQNIAAIRSLINYQPTTVKRAIVWGIPPFPTETTGTALRAALDAYNAATAAAFTEYWLDIPAWLRTTAPVTIGTTTVSDPFTFCGITPTSQDLTDIGNGITPLTMRASSTDGHFNTTYSGPAIAYRFGQELALRGWR